MNRDIIVDKNMLELNQHGSYNFPFNLLHIVLSAYPNARFNCHWHPEIEVTCILEGCMHYQVNQKSYILNKNDCLFVNSNALHSGQSYQNSECQYVVFDFNPLLIFGYEQSAIAENYVKPVLNSEVFFSLLIKKGEPNHSLVFESILEIDRQYISRGSCYELQIKSALCKLWSVFYQEFLSAVKNENHNPSLVKQTHRLKKALEYIYEHYSDPITLDEIAAACHTSKSEFCKIFKATLHQTPFDFLLRHRVQKSLPLLLNSERTITEVATESGFSGGSYYSEVFRKYMQCSPSQYRKQMISESNSAESAV